MALKQFKFNVEFILTINEITDDVVQEDILRQPDDKEFILEHLERQKRLQLALISNQNFLMHYIKQDFLDLLELDGKELVSEILFANPNQAREDITKKLVKTLNSEDQKFFEGADNEGLLSEQMEYFNLSTELGALKAVVEEI